MRRGLRVKAGPEESSNPTSCPALGDYPTGERRGRKKKRERKKERGRPREDQRMKTTFLQLQTFSLCKKTLFN